jgi:Ca-activated chloride channel family protein
MAMEVRMRSLAAMALALFAFVSYAGMPAPPVQSAPGVLAGIVKSRSGALVQGAKVELVRDGRVVQVTTTDAQGRFRFNQVAAGSYVLRAAAEGFETLIRHQIVAASGTDSVELMLAGGPVMKDMTTRAEMEQRPMVSGRAVAKEVAPGASVYPLASPPPAACCPGIVGPRFDTEAYDHIQDNRFHRVGAQPVSTFSIDVDTASYSNVRRFLLSEGRLPPADAVRTEELLNYFRFEYPKPNGETPFSVTTELGPCPWNPKHRLALIGLNTARLDLENTPPRNFVFLLDVSGSMMPADKLPLVKSAMRMLTETLRAEDRVAIVVYAGASGLALPSTPGSHKSAILGAIEELQAGGSTNGAAGIRLAYDTAQRAFIKGGINRVILATDGDFNVGVTSQGELVRLIEEERQRGIFLSVLGVGTGNVKDSTMEKLANKGNGNYAYLDSVQEARRVLIAEGGATLVTVAKDVKIQVEFNPAKVAAYRLIGYENRMLAREDFKDDKKDAGEIGAGHTVTAIYELIPPGVDVPGPDVDPLKYQQEVRPAGASKSGELMNVKLRFKQPDGETSREAVYPVTDRNSSSLTANLGFASAVTQFAMLLRKSEFKGRTSWPSTLELARRFMVEDPGGYRAEFIKLAGLAAAMDAAATTEDK